MPPPLDLSGQKYGRLRVIKLTSLPRQRSKWLCECDCGNTVEVFSTSLRTGHTKSCGCYNRELIDARKTHGMKGSREYSSWRAMRYRCRNPRCPAFPNYGGRGITVCRRWESSFLNFYADMGERPDRKTLDRIDNDGNYEPGNCRWATAKEQGRNTRATKLNPVAAQVIRYVVVNDGRSQRQVARTYGISATQVHRIVRGERWAA
jgi:hypothetical protein